MAEGPDGSRLGCVAPFAHLKSSSTHNMFHRPLFGVFCSTPPPSTPTSLPLTGIRRPPCATPHRGIQFGRLAESTPLTFYEPKTCIDVSSEHTPINYPSRRNSFDTYYNDLATTVAASEPPDMKEVGQSTSPLLFQDREVSSDAKCGKPMEPMDERDGAVLLPGRNTPAAVTEPRFAVPRGESVNRPGTRATGSPPAGGALSRSTSSFT